MQFLREFHSIVKKILFNYLRKFSFQEKFNSVLKKISGKFQGIAQSFKENFTLRLTEYHTIFKKISHKF